MWSPQRYLEEGRKRGIAELTLQSAVEQIERVHGRHPDLPAILTLNHLARRADVAFVRLRAAVEGTGDSYRTFTIRKRSGGRRLIYVPEPDLMRAQRWLAMHVLNTRQPHPASFAFAPGSSILRCAARHTGARWLVKMDVANFFHSISEIQIFRVFRELGYEKLISFELARLTTWFSPGTYRYDRARWTSHSRHTTIDRYASRRIRSLPQGAPTSPMLSNLAMRSLDAEIQKIARSAGLTYTRYSDDLTFSTREAGFDRTKALRLIHAVSQSLMRKGLFPNRGKTTIVPPGARKIVLGLLVDGSEPRLPREARDRLRQHIFHLEKHGPAAHARAREFDTIWGMRCHIRGLLDFACMVDDTYGQTLLQRFEALDWPM